MTLISLLVNHLKVDACLSTGTIGTSKDPKEHATRRYGHRYSLMVVSLYVLSGPASSQIGSNLPSSSSTASSSDLEEIVVTATKRETRLQDTPISMTVLSGGFIDENRVVSMTDVAQLVPSLVYIPVSGSETYLVIRGAATIDDSTGTDQGVSMFVDDVVRVSVADLQPELFDMDRVEVLKGPQGTLFGRNSIGGIVSLYTKDPTFKTDGATELTYGRYNLAGVNAMMNLPLVPDLLAARLVVSRHSNDGYIQDVTTHSYLDNDDTLAVRGKLLFTPSDEVRLVTGFDYLSKTGSDARWMIGNFQPALDPGLEFDPLKTAAGEPGRIDQKIWGLTSRLDWKTSVGDLTSITGYRHLQVFDASVVSGDPLVAEYLETTSHDSQVTEELRLASPLEQRFTWVTGVYYLHSDRARPIDVPINVLPNSFLSLITGVPASLVPYELDQDTRTTSSALFADGTYAIADQISLDIGGRYTREEKSGHSFVNLANIVTPPAISASYSNQWSAFTPKVTLSYKPSPSLMTYATVSRGFQSGGYNVQGSTASAFSAPFSSEYVINYEAGFKFDSPGHRLQANVSAFADRYTDLQIIQYDSANLTFTTNNAGKASVDGLEMDVTGLPLDWLTLGVKYDYIHSKFTDYVINNGPGVPPTVNTGNQLPFTAPQRVTASVETHWELDRRLGRVALGGDYTYRSPTYLTVANDDPAFVRNLTAWRGVVNLHASWMSANSRWQVLLWGKNVTHKYFTNLAGDQSIFLLSPTEANNPSLHIFDAQLAEPAWYGITVSMKL